MRADDSFSYLTTHECLPHVYEADELESWDLYEDGLSNPPTEEAPADKPPKWRDPLREPWWRSLDVPPLSPPWVTSAL